MEFGLSNKLINNVYLKLSLAFLTAKSFMHTEEAVLLLMNG